VVLVGEKTYDVFHLKELKIYLKSTSNSGFIGNINTKDRREDFFATF